MTIQEIFVRIIAYLFVFKAYIFPVLAFLGLILALIQSSSIRKKLSERLVIARKANPRRGPLIAGVVLFLFSLLFFVSNAGLSLVLFLLGVFCSLIWVRSEIYSNLNGLYSMGVVHERLTKWKEIHSWKKVDEIQVSFLNQKGERFEVAFDENTEKAVQYLKDLSIREDV